MIRLKHFAASLVVAGGLSVAAAALAADASLMIPANGQSLEPRGVITLQVLDSVPEARYANFFLQFDGDDITGLVSVNGRTVSYQPPAMLSAGDHILILFEKAGEQFVELARWTINVGGMGGVNSAGGTSGPISAPGPTYKISGNAAGQYNYLLSDNLENNLKVRPHSGTATVSAAGSFGGEKTQTDVKFNGFYDSREQNNAPDDDHFMLGEYLVTTRANMGDVTATFNAGNHDAGISNLVIDSYYRRGMSTRFDIGKSLRLTAFAQDPARAIGNSNVTGVAREEQRAEGGAVRFFPLPDSYGERVWVEGAGYTGKGTIAGDGAGIPSTNNNEGEGWAAAAEAQTLDDKINARADIGRTRFDEDGAGGPLPKSYDTGYRGRLAWSPIATLLTTDSSPERMQVAAQYHRYGTFYRSLANLGVPVDEQRGAVSTSYLKNSLSVTGEAYFAENNTSREPTLPTDRGMGVLANASVQPVFFWNDIDANSLLGRSTWSAGSSFAREKRHETPVGFVGDGLDQHTFTLNGGWSLAFDRFTGNASHTFTHFRNAALPDDSFYTHFSEISLTWLVNDRFTVTPAAQMQIQREHGPDVFTRQYFASLDTSTIIIPEKLSHTFHYGATLDDGTPAEDIHNAATELVWQVKQAALNDPGIAVALSALYDHQRRDELPPGSDKDEIYKVFLSLKIASPFGF